MATLPPPPPPKPTKSKTNHNGTVNNYVNGEHTKSHNGNNGSTSSLLVLDEEKVVMTPRGKTSNSTVLLIERKLIDSIGDRQHVAGGDHTGIIINKDTHEQKSQITHPQLILEFRVFLVSGNTGQHSQESRTLRFWFRPWLNDSDKQAHIAQDFFRELVSPKEFPRGKPLFSVTNLRQSF